MPREKTVKGVGQHEVEKYRAILFNIKARYFLRDSVLQVSDLRDFRLRDFDLRAFYLRDFESRDLLYDILGHAII